MINKTLDFNLQTRRNFISVLDSLTLEQANKIPEGYNNNVIWNFGHTIITTQLLCYKMSNLPVGIDETLVDEFKKGSIPKNDYSQDELDQLKSLAFSTIDQLISDLSNDVFQSYNQYTTSYNVTLSSIADAVAFITIHEGVHLGYAMALKKNI